MTKKKGLLVLLVLFALALPLWGGAEIVDSGTCGANGDNLTWILTDDGTLTIAGQGDSP